jgi:hypothetical protein
MGKYKYKTIANIRTVYVTYEDEVHVLNYKT